MKMTTKKPIATAEALAEINNLEGNLRTLSAGRTYFELSRAEQESYDTMRTRIREIRDSYDWYDQPFKEHGRTGIRDVFGNVVVPAQFDDFTELYRYDFRREVMPMILDGKAVLVKTDGTGDVISGEGYDSISYVAFTPYFLMSRDGKCGFMFSNGDVVLDCICDTYYEAINGIMPYTAGDKWGVLDMYGHATAPVFDDVLDVELDDFVMVRLGDKTGYIDMAGCFTLEQENAFWRSAED